MTWCENRHSLADIGHPLWLDAPQHMDVPVTVSIGVCFRAQDFCVGVNCLQLATPVEGYLTVAVGFPFGGRRVAVPAGDLARIADGRLLLALLRLQPHATFEMLTRRV